MEKDFPSPRHSNSSTEASALSLLILNPLCSGADEGPRAPTYMNVCLATTDAGELQCWQQASRQSMSNKISLEG